VGFAYVTSTATSPGGAGSVYEYTVLDDGSVAPLAQGSVAAGIEPAALAHGDGYFYVVNVGDARSHSTSHESAGDHQSGDEDAWRHAQCGDLGSDRELPLGRQFGGRYPVAIQHP